MPRADPYPTKTRLALMRDVDAGHIERVEHGRSYDVHAQPQRNVTARITELEEAGWVVLPFEGAEIWALTAAGRIVLDQHTSKRYRVTFDRIGRSHGVPPLEATALDADHLAEQIYRYARPHVRSSGVDVAVDLEALAGTIFCGFHKGGSFTIERMS